MQVHIFARKYVSVSINEGKVSNIKICTTSNYGQKILVKRAKMPKELLNIFFPNLAVGR